MVAFWSHANTSSPCVSGFTFGQTLATRPSGSITTVDRITPSYVLSGKLLGKLEQRIFGPRMLEPDDVEERDFDRPSFLPPDHHP